MEKGQVIDTSPAVYPTGTPSTSHEMRNELVRRISGRK